MPPRLDDVVRRALAQDPERRFQQVEDFERALGGQAPAGGATGWTGVATGDSVGVARRESGPEVRPRRSDLIWLATACALAIFGSFYLALFAYFAATYPGSQSDWRAFCLGFAALLLFAATGHAAYAAERLRRQGTRVGLGIAAFMTWYGPIALFCCGVIGFLAASPDVLSRPWILVIVGAVLLPLATWFLLDRVHRARQHGR